MYWTCGSGRVELEMTLEQARSASHSGQCYEDVKALMTIPKITRQLKKIDSSILAVELKAYGAWTPEELANHADNLERIVWIAACDISEEHGRKEYAPSAFRAR
jgi:hypothetical protein